MNNEPINGTPDPNAPVPEGNELVTLDLVYDKAFIGPAFSVSEPPRVAYSLVVLAHIERKRLGCDLEKARNSILALMQAVTESFGPRSPLFVDTSQSLRPKKVKKSIIQPGDPGFRPPGRRN